MSAFESQKVLAMAGSMIDPVKFFLSCSLITTHHLVTGS